MIRLSPEQTAALKNWFLPERPGALIGPHVFQTGNGVCRVDRWPAPRAVLVETAGNFSLSGQAQALAPADLQPHLKGFVETSEAFVPLLRAAFPEVKVWPRVAYGQQQAPAAVPAGRHPVRRLEPSDAGHLEGLSPELAWVSNTWGGPAGLAASGFGWGAFVASRLASVACTFFVGESYEDIGVVTEPEFRGLGLSPACALALCADIRARGRQPVWTTSPNNTASIRVAEKLGFSLQRNYVLYVVGISIPDPAEPPPQ